MGILIRAIHGAHPTGALRASKSAILQIFEERTVRSHAFSVASCVPEKKSIFSSPFRYYSNFSKTGVETGFLNLI
jgi:hypothetical protein